ncbi:WavE lipopolysaccharide synthesis family protein [Brachyspira intermedia]|uniref:WavE lipopolysaccharide synthesis family protein n=1 Tax=Brachyspira intermedia TaxID=84377 RepID=UPI00300658CF
MIVGNIDTKDISVVVQGGIDQKYTSDCLKSIRKHLPDSEIILSTWEGSDADGLDYDIIIFNKKIEKNFIDNEVLNLVNNTNRQIISTQNGIKKASKKYILKLRTDSLLLNNNFLKYFDKFQNRNKKYIGFKNRVIVPSVYAREYSNDIKLCLTFHPSDFYFFGLEEDIKDYLLDVELLKDNELSGFYFKYNNLVPSKNFTWIYAPEQYICTSWAIKRFNNIHFHDWSDINYKNYKDSLNILYNNFTFLDLEQSGITNTKHSWAFENSDKIDGLITYRRFLQRYYELCSNDDNSEENNYDEQAFYINNITGYIDFQTNNINNQMNNINNTINNYLMNNNRKNIFTILGDFIFSIKYLQGKKIITLFGFKITTKSSNKYSI